MALHGDPTTIPRLLVDDASLADTADDFGHIVRGRPRAVVRPTSAEEVVALVNLARRDGVRLVARGAGHSVFGQSQIEDGWVVDTSALAGVRVDGHTAVVGAGARWRDVVRVSLANGLSPPVLTDYAGLTVGGTLSVGGVGGESFRFGVQTDHVVGMTVVTGDGVLRHCSRTHEVELFDHVRAGLGLVGIVTEVELRMIEVPSLVRHYRIVLPSLEQAITGLERLVMERRFDQLSAVGVVDRSGGWTFHIDAVHAFEPGAGAEHADLVPDSVSAGAQVLISEATRLDYATRLDADVAGWQASGLSQAPHPWVDVFLPEAALPAFARFVVDMLEPQMLGTEAGMLLVYPIATAGISTPLLPVPTSDGRAYLFDVLRCLPGTTGPAMEAILSQNRSIYERASSLGGSLYPISAVRMSSSDWQHHFGPRWESLVAARRHYDPQGLLGSGYSITANPS